MEIYYDISTDQPVIYNGQTGNYPWVNGGPGNDILDIAVLLDKYEEGKWGTLNNFDHETGYLCEYS